ncbi:hypothetical protein ROG8370_02826 [Roseovarius gaetbuli]|uniref:Uncharacterized protein n=1 Tax=Roseovarius gaetbuli TaxID=1356575 RepID=A0A1X6ZU40_9RHOB|nr:hypothetical protein [Roseovarius gaetbuli]SLN61221.1 hypothetical protein ROG8370_02826 [Roseovarius gaetbuli]
MVKIFGAFLSIVFLVAVCIGTIFLAYYGWNIAAAVVKGAKTLEPNIYVPLVVTLLTASIGLAATLYTQTKTRIRETEG